MKKNLALLLIVFSAVAGFSQGEGNHWYFGYNAGLDFSNGAPLPDLNGALSTWEGSSSVSDKNGNLLFYTDGVSVYDRNHSLMPNGTGLLGNSSSTQSAVIVKKPGADTIYYIFTTPEGSGGIFAYSEVNLLHNGGLGDIVLSTKNTSMMPFIGERVTATKHSNGVFTWVITKRNGTSDYYAYLIDCNGIQNPVITTVGWTAAGDNAGTTVTSPNGKKVAATYFSSSNGIEILDFDNSTGIFSNPITQTLSAYPYGVSFSPNSNLVYHTNISSGDVTQLDLTAGNGSANDVLASATIVGNISVGGAYGYKAGALQLGPDNKLYMAENGQGSISVINNPNIQGVGCNFAGDAISLGGKISGLGLPSFFLNFIDTAAFTFDAACENSPTLFTLSGDITALDSVHWDFGDLSTGNNNFSSSFSPSHIFSGAGSFNVQLIKYFLCGSDTNNLLVTVIPNTITAAITGADSICSGNSLQLTASGGLTYNWTGPGSFSDTLPTISISSPVSGMYTLIAEDANGCADTANQYVNIFPNPVAVATSNSPVPIGDSIFLVTDTSAGISWIGPNSFASSQQNPEIINAQFSDTGTYQVIKTNVFGCSDTAEVFVSVYQPEIPDNNIDDDNDNLIDCADPDLATLPQCYRCGYDSVAWQTVIPEPGFNRGIAIKYTGFEQHFVVPPGVSSIKVKAWGAGGGGGYMAYSVAAGAGGFTVDQFNVTAGETYVVVSGEGGWATRHVNQTARATFGYGGSGNSMGAAATSETGSGGGLSGLFISSVTQANARVIAGGGGGIADTDGVDETSGGNGNTPLSGGYLPLTGQDAPANSKGFGGGGGGYFGGISGISRFSFAGHLPETSADGGEGGSGFVFTSGGQIKFTPELNIYPPDTADDHYIPGVGVGNDYDMAIGASGDIKTGGNGLVVIQWFEPIDDLTVTASKNSLCQGDTLTLIAEGPGIYTWSPAATLNSTTSPQVIATPVSDITYQVISDNNNCMDTAEVQIVVNPLPDANFGADTVCHGEITLFTDSSFVSGGNITGSAWSFGNGVFNSNATNPGYQYPDCGIFNARLLVTTNNGCKDSVTKTVIVHCRTQSDAGPNDTVCFSGSTVITVTPNGAGYSYSWNAPANPNFSNAYNPSVNPTTTTSYTVALTDANGCATIDSVTVFADSEITSIKTVSNVSCNSACDGQIDIAVTGGITPYEYTWSGGCASSSCNNLCPGSYSLTITDVWGCTATADTTISEPSPLLAFINNFTSASCNSACDGTASAVATGGTPGAGYSYSWNTLPGQNTPAADSLCAGTYICSVTDANSCMAKDTIVITAPTAISLLVSTTATDCNDSTGTATVSVFGGTAGYSYSWSPGGDTIQSVASLAAGTYTVTVTDTNGCSQSQTAIVNTVSGPSIIVTASDNNILSGTTTMLNTTGNGSYHWSPNTTLDCDTCQITVASPLETTTYCVVVTDTNKCADSSCITIVVEYPCDLAVPNAFSPNNDGSNDLLTLHGWDKCVSEFSIIIFNRWGEKVFESSNPSASWDGNSKNEKTINSAVFVYYISATLNSGESITRQGNISLIK